MQNARSGSLPSAEVEDLTITGYLARDHDRLDCLLEEARGLLAAGAPEPAAARFAEFRGGLLRHIRMEEDILFPAFEAATGLGIAGPTEVMRHEHRDIRRLLDMMADAFEVEDPGLVATFERLRAQLLSVLVDHNLKEERVLYPMSDQLLPGVERDVLLRKLKAV